MTARLPVIQHSDGRLFAAEERVHSEISAYPNGIKNDDQVRGFVSNLWDKHYEAQVPEHQRMSRCQRYYDGHHYANALDNLNNEVTNYPFSIVESVHPEMIEQKPRPQIVPGYGTTDAQARQIGELATWLMNTAGFDRSWRLSRREMLKLGWCTQVIAFDHRTGMPFPKPYNNWNFYPDPTAAHEDDMMTFFLAGPVNTGLLRNMFPDKRSMIVPDGWVSPSYDALVRADRELMSNTGSHDVPRFSNYAAADRAYSRYSGDFANATNETTPSGTAFLANPGGFAGQDQFTTFLWQLFYRDMRTMKVAYNGKVKYPNGQWHWGVQVLDEPVCTSGWNCIQMLSNGTVLDIGPVDDCFSGIPIVIGRDYEQAFKMFSHGEIDQVISKTKAINRRLNLLNLALEFQCNTPLIVDMDSKANFNKSGIGAGDVIKKMRGSQIAWLDFRGPTEQQFALLDGERRDVDVISGVHDVSQGQRPPGIEAGSAINLLQMAAAKRIRGKDAAGSAEAATLLKKLMHCMGKKLNRRIMYRASNGETVTMDPEVLANEYAIQFVPGSGLQASREMRKAEAKELFAAGLIDQQAALEAIDWPDRDAIIQRTMIQRQQEAAIAAASEQEQPA